MTQTETTAEEKRRRRFAGTITPVGIAPATPGGTIGLLGFVMLMQGSACLRPPCQWPSATTRSTNIKVSGRWL
jgi:hypothetical protein